MARNTTFAARHRVGPRRILDDRINLAVYPPAAVIKVDDTEPGIAEGIAAGCVTVGVCLSGNEAGLTPEELEALSSDELAAIRARVTAELKAAGAHHVIDTVADLPALIESLQAKAA